MLTSRIDKTTMGNDEMYNGRDAVIATDKTLYFKKKRLWSRFFVSLKHWYIISPLIIDIIVTITCKIFFKVFAFHKVYGIENIQHIPRGAIFAANHSSELDPVLVSVSLPLFSHFLPMFYTSRDKTFYKSLGLRRFLYGGLLFKMMGAYQVYVGKFNYQESLKSHISIINDGYSVCIFPEGKKYTEGKFGEPKGGVSYLSYVTNQPVIPVAIMGATHSSLWRFFTFQKKYRVVFGKPIYPKDIFPDLHNVVIGEQHDDCRTAAKVIMENIDSMIKQH